MRTRTAAVETPIDRVLTVEYLDRMVKKKLQELGIWLDRTEQLLSKEEIETGEIDCLENPVRFEVDCHFGRTARMLCEYVTFGNG